MKSIIESIRGARYIEVILLVVVICAAALFVFNGSSRQSGNEKTDLELRLERLLERIEGAGDIEVMIASDESDRPVGVAIVTDRRLNMRTQLDIQSAVQALLNIELQRIRIIGREGVDG